MMCVCFFFPAPPACVIQGRYDGIAAPSTKAAHALVQEEKQVLESRSLDVVTRRAATTPRESRPKSILYYKNPPPHESPDVPRRRPQPHAPEADGQKDCVNELRKRFDSPGVHASSPPVAPPSKNVFGGERHTEVWMQCGKICPGSAKEKRR